jgi:hypothetical protein
LGKRFGVDNSGGGRVTNDSDDYGSGSIPIDCCAGRVCRIQGFFLDEAVPLTVAGCFHSFLQDVCAGESLAAKPDPDVAAFIAAERSQTEACASDQYLRGK